jgi:atrial natriuretic peptide receptor A
MTKYQNRRGSTDINLRDWDNSEQKEEELVEDHAVISAAPEINVDAVYDSLQSKKDDECKSTTHVSFSSKQEGLKKHAQTVSTFSSNPSSSNSSRWTRIFTSNATLWDNIHGNTFDRGDVDDDENVAFSPTTCRQTTHFCLLSMYYESVHFFKNLIKNPHLALISLAVCGAFLALSLLLIESQKNATIDKAQATANWIACETAEYFSAQFKRSLVPLYTVQQSVSLSSYFDDLHDAIGPYPNRIIPGTETSKLMRDVTDVCGDPNVQGLWKEVVYPSIAVNKLDDIVIAYRLAPQAVQCLQYGNMPFSPGHDSAKDPNSPFWKGVTTDIFIDNNYNVFGPFGPNNDLFCSHLSVFKPTDVPLDVHGTLVENAWGYVMNFINWNALKDKSGVDKKFNDAGFEYQLSVTRPGKEEGTSETVILASSSKFDELEKQNSITIKVQTIAGEWDHEIGTLQGWTPNWYVPAIVGATIASFLIGLLTAVVLVGRKLHRNLLLKIMPQDAISKLQRGQTVLERFNIATIFFSDIVGFTTMSGEMTPIQVMKMLNELYIHFDKLVKKHKVYKVETIGDAYMVVGGAPYRCTGPEAAERVALFAIDAIAFVKNFRSKDNHQIYIRAGIASGKVVAGVVGEAMPRYCFFGDTVNVASRMESTSTKMRIQCSDLTARLLENAPTKSFTLVQRQEGNTMGVEIKGKGLMQTWWIEDVGDRGETKVLSDVEHSVIETENDTQSPDEGYRVVFDKITNPKWENLTDIDTLTSSEQVKTDICHHASSMLISRLENLVSHRDNVPTLSVEVQLQIELLVDRICNAYNNVNFHSIEHAYHVMTAMNKLVSISNIMTKDVERDYLSEFALVFSALVHDVGHTGMSNQFLKDQSHPLASRYSVDIPIAEFYSIELAMEFLFDDNFTMLRDTIFRTELELIRFIKVIFQSICITDITSKTRMSESIARYNMITSSNVPCSCKEKDPKLCTTHDSSLCPLGGVLDLVLKAAKLPDTVVQDYPQEFVVTRCGLKKCVFNEVFMLASDVSAPMQNWKTFTKWNFRLYKEILDCHSKKLCPNPHSGWSKGEIGFFQFYIIPLAKRLDALVPKGDENTFAELAEKNLELWKLHGDDVTRIFLEGVESNQEEEEVLNKVFKLVGDS